MKEILIGERIANVPDTFKSPYKAGMLWHDGWEMPQLWALDVSGGAYTNDAHGGALQVIPVAELLTLLAGKNDVAEITVRRELGLKPRLPQWMRTALAKGWTPPSDFNRNDYE